MGFTFHETAIVAGSWRVTSVGTVCCIPGMEGIGMERITATNARLRVAYAEIAAKRAARSAYLRRATEVRSLLHPANLNDVRGSEPAFRAGCDVAAEGQAANGVDVAMQVTPAPFLSENKKRRCSPPQLSTRGPSGVIRQSGSRPGVLHWALGEDDAERAA
jgi:hypothetical protein